MNLNLFGFSRCGDRFSLKQGPRDIVFRRGELIHGHFKGDFESSFAERFERLRYGCDFRRAVYGEFLIVKARYGNVFGASDALFGEQGN